MVTIIKALQNNRNLPGDTPVLDAELLLCGVLNCQSSYLRAWPDRELSDEQESQFASLIDQRVQGVPVAHLLGRQAFWTLELEVSPITLIPRQDTERLVEQSLELGLPSDAMVLDLGTGTGAIALAIATERPLWSILGTDFRAEITALAERNAQHNHIANADFMVSDWFKALAGQQFDLIVSNPPYIAPTDPHLGSGDLRFEAKTALVADKHGMAALELIADEARGYLKEGGWLLMEHGYDQALLVRACLERFKYSEVLTRQDFGGNDRVTAARYRTVQGVG